MLKQLNNMQTAYLVYFRYPTTQVSDMSETSDEVDTSNRAKHESDVTT